MPIRFLCRECTARIKVADGTEGRKVKCPKCGASQRVPHSQAEEATAPLATSDSSSPSKLSESSPTEVPTTISVSPPAPAANAVSSSTTDEENNPLAALAAAAAGEDTPPAAIPVQTSAEPESAIPQVSLPPTPQPKISPTPESAVSPTPEVPAPISSSMIPQPATEDRKAESSISPQVLSEPERMDQEPERPSNFSASPETPATPVAPHISETKEAQESLDSPAPAVVPSPVRPLPRVIPMVGGSANGLSASRPGAGVSMPKPIPLATPSVAHADVASLPHPSHAVQGVPLVDETEPTGSVHAPAQQPSVRPRPSMPVPTFAGLLWVSWLLMGFAGLIGFVSILSGLLYLIRSGDGLTPSQILGLVLLGVLVSVLTLAAALALQALRDLVRNSYRSG